MLFLTPLVQTNVESRVLRFWCPNLNSFIEATGSCIVSLLSKLKVPTENQLAVMESRFAFALRKQPETLISFCFNYGRSDTTPTVVIPFQGNTAAAASSPSQD